MDTEWLFVKNNDNKSNKVKAIVIPETNIYESNDKKPVMQEVGLNVNNLEVVKKNLSEAIDRGYSLLGMSETKRVLKRLLEAIEEEEDKENG